MVGWRDGWVVGWMDVFLASLFSCVGEKPGTVHTGKDG